MDEAPAGSRVVASRALLVGVLSLFIYFPSLGFDFIGYDDFSIVLNQAYLYGESSFGESVRQIFTALPREEPLILRDLSWAVNGAIFGAKSAFGYHLGNVVANVVCSVLAFLLAYSITRKIRLALVVGLGYAVLAVRSEAVAWVMGRRKIFLSGCLMFAALLTETMSWREPRAGARRVLYGLGLLASALAPLAKVSAAPLPVVLMLLDLFRRHLAGEVPPRAPLDLRASAPRALRFLPHLVLSVAFARWYHGQLMAYGVLGVRGPGMSTEYLLVLGSILPLVFARYVQLFVLPSELSISYDWPATSTPLTTPETIFAIGFWPLVVVLTVVLWRRRKDFLFYWLAFLLLMVPYMNLEYVGIWIANRYLSVTAFFVLVPFASWIFEVWPRLERQWRAGIGAAAIGVALINFGEAVTHQFTFQDSTTLWTYETALAYPSMVSFTQLTQELLKAAGSEPDPARRDATLALAEETIDRGIAHYATRVEKPSPWMVPAPLYAAKLHFHRSEVSGLRGAPPERRIELALEAYRLNPKSPMIWRGLGEAYMQLALSKAGPEQEAAARTSLKYFESYLRSVRTPLERRSDLSILDNAYAAKFPFLCDELHRVKQQLFLPSDRSSGPCP